MQIPVDRRAFLKGAAAAAVVPLAGTDLAQARTGKGKPRLLTSCCAYSYGRYLAKDQMTMEQFVVKAAELGVVGVELTAYWIKSTEPGYLFQLKNVCHSQGVPVSGTAIGAQMCQPAGAKRDEVLDTVKKWIDASALLGAPQMRVFANDTPKGAAESQCIDWVVETMKPACDYAGKKGIVLGLETHYGLTAKPANVIQILKRLDTPYAGCTLDVTNWNDDPYGNSEACLPYAVSAHIRDIWGEKKQPLDLDRIWRMFATAGFRGFLCAEYESEEDPMTGVPKLVETMKALSKKYSTV